jgi:hypothetical protein
MRDILAVEPSTATGPCDRLSSLSEVSVEVITKLKAELERAGVEFTNGKKPGVRLSSR